MEVHDLVVIGSGPAGDTAALYAQRAGIQTLVLEKAAFGGQVSLTSKIDNYPGAISIDGYSLMESMRSQAQEFGATYENCEVLEVCQSENRKLFRMTTTTEDVASRAVIACLGSKYALAGFKGEKEFTGRGVSYCATCDGMFYRNKQVFVCGGGNSAAQEALHLSHIASRVVVLVRKNQMRADRFLVHQLEQTENIEIRYNVSLVEVSGNELVSSLIIRDNVKGTLTKTAFDEGSVGVFVFVGNIPQTKPMKSILDLNESGYINTDQEMRTSVKGLFAAGDCRAKTLRQIITAASDGAIAAHAAAQYLADIKSR